MDSVPKCHNETSATEWTTVSTETTTETTTEITTTEEPSAENSSAIDLVKRKRRKRSVIDILFNRN